jgi:prefoldin subunit 5
LTVEISGTRVNRTEKSVNVNEIRQKIESLTEEKQKLDATISELRSVYAGHLKRTIKKI